jgi:hypothetical protein
MIFEKASEPLDDSNVSSVARRTVRNFNFFGLAGFRFLEL